MVKCKMRLNMLVKEWEEIKIDAMDRSNFENDKEIENGLFNDDEG